MDYLEDDEVVYRIRSAKSLIQMGTHSSNPEESENILYQACDLLEHWCKEFEKDEQETGNPFIVLRAQARHRLGQITLQRGNLALALHLFQQVVLNDPHTLSPQALAMTWYDVALIYIAYGSIIQAQEALGKSFSTLMQQNNQQGAGMADETLLYFIHKAMLRLVELFEQKVSVGHVPPLSWSSQFTVVSYHYGQNEQQIAGEEVIRECYYLFDASLCHARAA
jgi:tetratricopeptide (TPR) repeat protein